MTQFAVRNPLTNALVLVTYGECGYTPCLNEDLGETLELQQGVLVTESARIGSMFGWDCPAAALARATPAASSRLSRLVYSDGSITPRTFSGPSASAAIAATSAESVIRTPW